MLIKKFGIFSDFGPGRPRLRNWNLDVIFFYFYGKIDPLTWKNWKTSVYQIKKCSTTWPWVSGHVLIFWGCIHSLDVLHMDPNYVTPEICNCQCWGGPSIFVLRQSHLRFVYRLLCENEKKNSCVHKYSNGFLIYISDFISVEVISLLLQSRRIFHQKFWNFCSF